MSSHQLVRPPEPAAPDHGRSLGRAWIGVALVPVFFFLAFAVGEGLYALMGYQPEDADAPVWAVLVASLPTVLVCLVPCAAAVYFGRQTVKGGDRRGIYPLAIGAVVGVGWLVLTIVSEVGNVLRR